MDMKNVDTRAPSYASSRTVTEDQNRIYYYLYELKAGYILCLTQVKARTETGLFS